MNNSYVVQLEAVRRVYQANTPQEVEALKGVSLQISPGRMVALKGRSGSGKTTLLNCIGALDSPTSGTVRVFAQDLSTLDEAARTGFRRDYIGYVFQALGLSPVLSAYENVELMLRMAGAPRRERAERTRACLALVGLERWAHHRPAELSGGQQQRVAIARALANRPQLLLADEPTGKLDTETARTILGLFRQIADQERVTVLMASHDPLVDDYVDDILHLRQGTLWQESKEGIA